MYFLKPGKPGFSRLSFACPLCCANFEGMIRILILAALVLAACNPQRYVLKQLDTHPEWASDTVTLRVTDTLVVPGYGHGTTFSPDLSESTDTLSVNKDTVRV